MTNVVIRPVNFGIVIRAHQTRNVELACIAANIPALMLTALALLHSGAAVVTTQAIVHTAIADITTATVVTAIVTVDTLIVTITTPMTTMTSTTTPMIMEIHLRTLCAPMTSTAAA